MPVKEKNNTYSEEQEFVFSLFWKITRNYVVNQVADATDEGSKKKKKKRGVTKKEKQKKQNKSPIPEEAPCDGDDDLEEEALLEEGFGAGRMRSSSQLISESHLNEVAEEDTCAEDTDDDQALMTISHGRH